MDVVNIGDVAPFSSEKFVAQEVIAGEKSNVRIIRLGPGQALPPHTHGDSDLFLYIVEGEGQFDTQAGKHVHPAGSLISMKGSEELRVTNTGRTGLTLLAFLSPRFPPTRA